MTETCKEELEFCLVLDFVHCNFSKLNYYFI
jgi:hypothetical protein